jgi:hypothetical protein
MELMSQVEGEGEKGGGLGSRDRQDRVPVVSRVLDKGRKGVGRMTR